MVATVLSQPISRLIFAAFVTIALVPLIFLSIKVHQEAWNDAWREINEKHRLLAMNLASPISIYVNDQRNLLDLLANHLKDAIGSLDAAELEKTATAILSTTLRHIDGISDLSLIDANGDTLLLAQGGISVRGRDQLEQKFRRAFAEEACYLRTRETGEWVLSNIRRSIITGKPTFVITQPVLGRAGAVIGVLLAELRMDVIENLRRNIHFGEKGHSAIVDKTGRVIAHPNSSWMEEMHDLSSLEIVKAMMRGETGVTEFYSPFVKQDMVAGYTAVPGIGWGIMVPQPRSEVEAQVRTLIYAQLRWGLVGILLVIVLAVPLARWITRPINQLANAAYRMEENDYQGKLPQISRYVPREMQRLHGYLFKLIGGLQDSRSEIRELNKSLQHKVDEATRQLREANSRLEVLATKDFLTQLSNRRYFEKTLSQKLSDANVDYSSLCIMLIDIDNFKEINDTYGHAAGDAVLVQIAPMLQMNMRASDIVARYGGDEFVIQMQCSAEVGMSRARELRAKLESWDFTFQDKVIKTTASIGLLYHEKARTSPVGHVDIQGLLQKADKAMYEAKRRGRNTVVKIAY